MPTVPTAVLAMFVPMAMLAMAPNRVPNTTVMQGLVMSVPAPDNPDVRTAKALGDPLRGRAFRCNLPSVDFRCNPCRLRERPARCALSLARRLASLTAACRADTVAAAFDGIVHRTAASSSPRRLRAALVAVLASLAPAGCAGRGQRLGSSPSHSVPRRCRLRRPPARALRRARVSWELRATPCTAPCTRARTSADPRAGAAAGAAGTVPRTTARSSVRTARRSLAAAAPFRRLRRRRFPHRSCRSISRPDRPGRPWFSHRNAAGCRARHGVPGSAPPGANQRHAAPIGSGRNAERASSPEHPRPLRTPVTVWHRLSLESTDRWRRVAPRMTA